MTLSQTSSRHAVLIVAAGRGRRMGTPDGGAAKQYLDVGGRSVLGHSLEVFAAHPKIGLIQVVIHPDDLDLYHQAIAECAIDDSKLLAPTMGGATRQISTLNGLDTLAGHSPTTVLIHDAARPFVRCRIVDQLLAAVTETSGAIPALPIADTIKRTSQSGLITETPDRENLWRAQTPQIFPFDGIHSAHISARESEAMDFTDDASVAAATGMVVTVLPGEDALRKITTPEDLTWAEAYLEARKERAMGEFETRVGQGFDVHAFAEGDHVILCGVRIPFDKRLSGHSDADVGLHALTDAILGGLGDGDIGTHFPPSDPQWKGADSVVFLKDALDRVTRRGGTIRHIDVTLICELPKIGPHRPAMTERLCALLQLTEDRVSVKATTTERLGFPGRGEGIAALATATLALPAV